MRFFCRVGKREWPLGQRLTTARDAGGRNLKNMDELQTQRLLRHENETDDRPSPIYTDTLSLAL